MPFLKRGHPLTRFRLLGQPSRETLLQAAEHLARVGFRPIDTLPDETAAGWVNGDDPTDSEWCTSRPDRLAHLFWTLRYDKRTVPAQLLDVRTRLKIKERLERRRAEIKEKVLINFVNKDEKAEIREQVRLALLSQTAPVPTLADVVWINHADADTAELWLCSTQSTLVDMVRPLFDKTFNVMVRPVTPFTPRPPEAEDWPESIGNRFLTWLQTHDGHSLDVAGTDVAVNFERLTIADTAGDCVIKAIVGESDPDEVERGLGNGMLVRECDLFLGIAGDGYKVRVKGEDFTMRLETTFWHMDREDPDGSFADKVLSVERFNTVWDKLYRLWLVQEKRLSEEQAAKPENDVKPLAAQLARQGATSVEKTAGGVTVHYKDGSSMTVIRGGK
jgi:hypothetical protein